MKAVRYFLDFRNFDSYNLATVEMNPKGKTDIKIVRDNNGDITGAEPLTADEIEDFFGDIGNLEVNTGIWGLRANALSAPFSICI